MITEQITTAPVVKEVTISVPASAVWKAITDKEQMKHWYFDMKNFEPLAGYHFTFDSDCEGEHYRQICCVTEVIRNKKLSYTWAYDGYVGESLVTFELFEENGGTKLVLTHAGLETFPQDNKNFAKECFAEGWEKMLYVELAKFFNN